VLALASSCHERKVWPHRLELCGKEFPLGKRIGWDCEEPFDMQLEGRQEAYLGGWRAPNRGRRLETGLSRCGN